MEKLDMGSLENSRVTDLVSAIQQNDGQRVNLLLRLDVQPDQLEVESGWSALHAAVLFAPNLLPALLAHCKHPDIALVMGGTALSYVVASDQAPLALARMYGLSHIEELLLDHSVTGHQVLYR